MSRPFKCRLVLFTITVNNYDLVSFSKTEHFAPSPLCLHPKHLIMEHNWWIPSVKLAELNRRPLSMFLDKQNPVYILVCPSGVNFGEHT